MTRVSAPGTVQGARRLPVAMMMFLPSRTLPFTTTLWADSTTPLPITTSMALLAKSADMPMAISLETPSLRATTALQSKLPISRFSPKSPAFFACSSNDAALSHILLGMQPRNTQVPPMAASSTRTTFPFNWAARMAAAYPPGPPPRTMTSYMIPISSSERPTPGGCLGVPGRQICLDMSGNCKWLRNIP